MEKVNSTSLFSYALSLFSSINTAAKKKSIHESIYRVYKILNDIVWRRNSLLLITFYTNYIRKCNIGILKWTKVEMLGLFLTRGKIVLSWRLTRISLEKLAERAVTSGRCQGSLEARREMVVGCLGKIRGLGRLSFSLYRPRKKKILK